MSHHDHHHHHHHYRHESERHRKQREKNRRNWLIFLMSERSRIQVSLCKPGVQITAKSAKKEPKVWSKQLVSIRNRLDNSKRSADDRFNRFAGTSDGGGRGR